MACSAAADDVVADDVPFAEFAVSRVRDGQTSQFFTDNGRFEWDRPRAAFCRLLVVYGFGEGYEVIAY